jgi:acetyl esterase/lipase
MQSALSSFPQAGPTADLTGLRVIAVDYTLAPHAQWQEVTDQVVTVFKEQMLSTFVRLYQAMDTAGNTVKLDLYEGMPHVFQAVPNLPESKSAVAKAGAFLKQYLGE